MFCIRDLKDSSVLHSECIEFFNATYARPHAKFDLLNFDGAKFTFGIKTIILSINFV